MSDECPLCGHGDRAELERAVLRGEMAKRDLAEMLDVGVQIIWEHFNDHTRPSDLTTQADKRGVLTDSIYKLQTIINHVYAAQEWDRTSVQQITALMNEARQSVKTLQEIEDGRKKEQHITIEQYNDFRSIIIAKIITKIPELCPECQKIWYDLLKDLEEIENEQPTVIEITDRNKGVQ